MVLALGLAVLAGCDETLSSGGVSSEDESGDTQNGSRIDLFPEVARNARDSVEAPEVFEVTEAGLWDGRPSLGGIWVAHPDVTQPERVVIKNAANDRSITGALFRREKDLPGPALQLSSEAAEQLGILAGSPTRVQVVALRRKPVEEVDPEEPQEIATTDPDEAPVAEETAPKDEAVETASADTEKPQKRKWWQKKETVAAAGVAGAAVAATGTAAEATVDTTEEVVEAAALAEPDPTQSDSETTPLTEKPKKRKWWQKKETVAAAGVAGAATAATDTAAEATVASTQDAVETAALAAP